MVFISIVKMATMEEDCPVTCADIQKISDSRVAQYCRKNSLKIKERCCFNETVIVGLDLSHCDLDNTAILVNSIYHGLNVLDLTNNIGMKIDDDNFDGYEHLETVYVDDKQDCPGGSDSWNIAKKEKRCLTCESQKNTCLDFYCPKASGNNGSHCESHGPGLKNRYCVCNPGFEGYKCMRQGTFPWPAFGAGIGGITLVLAIFLWCTNRRLVKSHSE